MQLLHGVMFHFRCLTGARNIMTKENWIVRMIAGKRYLQTQSYELCMYLPTIVLSRAYHVSHETAVFAEILWA
jgi:hypothetical protein